MKSFWLVGCLFPLMGMAYTVHYAGETFVNLDAADLGAVYTAGAVVRTWSNSGTTADFVSVHATDGPTYQVRNGVPVLRFTADATKTAMTNGVPGSVPASILGANPYTIEIWAFSESVNGTRTMFATTSRAGLSDNNGSVLEMRYSADAGNGVEHYGAAYNLAWYGMPGTAPTGWGSFPAAGEWHHICETYDGCRATLYLNGRPISSRLVVFRHADDGAFTVGGVWFRDNKNFGNGYGGDIGRIRVHDGVLTPAEVMENFLAEVTTFSRSLTGLDPYFFNGAWLSDVSAKAGAGLTAEGPDAARISGLTGYLHYLNLANGAALITAGSNLSVDTREDSCFVGASFGAGSLTVDSAVLTVTNSVKNGVFYGKGVITVGGSAEAPGVLACTTDFYNGLFEDGTGTVHIAENGIVRANYYRNGDRVNTASGMTVVDAGGLLEVNQFIINGALAGYGEMFVSGTVRSINSQLFLGESGGTGVCEILPGGLVECVDVRPYANTPAGNGYMRVKGGTLAFRGRVAELQEFSFTDGATFSVPAGSTGTVESPLSDATPDGGGAFHKTGGGELQLRVNATVTGELYVDEGTVRFVDGGLPSGAVGTVHVAEGASIGYDTAGGIAALLPRIDKESKGAIIVYGNNVAENIDLSEYPYLKVQFHNIGTFTGTITPYQNLYRFVVDSGVNTYSGTISDIAGYPARVIVEGADSACGMRLSGDNRAMSGAVTVGSGRLVINHQNAGGIGQGQIHLAVGTVLKIECAVPIDFINQRVAATSRPKAIYLTAASIACDIDQSLFPDTLICSEGENIKHTGTFTPDPASGYLFGSGGTAWYYASNTGFMPGALKDGNDGPAKVTVREAGLVNLSANGHTYSGGTEISGNGAVFAVSDGFGAVPETFDESNILLNLGIIRSGNADFTLNANRGVRIGPEGAEFHPWGSYTMTIAGGLTGSGPIKITDGGHLAFSGAHNTYQGTITQATGGTITIGGGATYSWASTGGFNQNNADATLVINTDSDAAYGDTVTGSGTFLKKGSGSLTLNGGLNGYAGALNVQAGTLHFPVTANAAKVKAVTINRDARITFEGNRSLRELLGASLFMGAGSIAIGQGQSLDGDWRPNQCGISLDAAEGASVTLRSPLVASRDPLAISNGTLALAPVADNTVTSLSGWRLNSNAGCCLVNEAGTELQLTDAVGSHVGAAWWTNRIDITHPFTVTFTYHSADGNSSPADGFAWMLQTSAAGPTAIGGGGGSIGASDISPSFGICNNIYTSHQTGWLVNGGKQNLTDVKTNNKIELWASDKSERAVTYTVTYTGRALTQTLTQGGNTFTLSRDVDLAAALGATSAWFGFTGATGGSYARQWITGFSFTSAMDPTPFPETLSDAGWQVNGDASFTTIGDQAAVRLTPNEGSKGGTLFSRVRVNTMKPFVLRGVFKAGNGSGNPADGWCVIVQNNGLNVVGAVGGSIAVAGGNINTAVGWGINIYNDDSFRWISGGELADTYSTILSSGIDMANQNPVDFTFTYTGSALTMRLEQAGHSVEVSRDVDLASVFGTDSAYIGLTAATGGATLEMNVYDVTVEQERPSVASVYDLPVTLSGTTALKAEPTIDGARTPMLADLTLADGAAVTVSCAGDSGKAYAVGASGLTVEGSASMDVLSNGSADGAFILAGTIDFGEAGLLAIAGPVAFDGKVTLRIPELSGRRNLMDLSGATGFTAEDFELECPSPLARLYCNMETGWVYAINNTGAVMILR